MKRSSLASERLHKMVLCKVDKPLSSTIRELDEIKIRTSGFFVASEGGE